VEVGAGALDDNGYQSTKQSALVADVALNYVMLKLQHIIRYSI